MAELSHMKPVTDGEEEDERTALRGQKIPMGTSITLSYSSDTVAGHHLLGHSGVFMAYLISFHQHLKRGSIP